MQEILGNDLNVKASILVIEDEPHLRATIKDVLSFDGYRVITAPNGKIGVEKAIEHMPDLIVCDIMMPEKDGYQVIQEVRGIQDLDMVPFVFLSAKYSPADLRKGMKLMADDYLVKPFRNKDLLEVVETRLSKVENLKRAFEKITDKLAARKKQLREYSFITSHHIRGPLCNILGLIDIMQDQEDLVNHPLILMLRNAAFKLDSEIQKANEVLSLVQPELGSEPKGGGVSPESAQEPDQAGGKRDDNSDQTAE
ncbi:MAG: response regulator [Bacteroidota bacterium]